ncbi:ATP-binding protein [Mucilaginibacter sp. X5P1]|uniref:hybrid sensor histidine kinase/response regulator n=1 Tax=Mucilaginibacter sp. X5P1 TaxID=2723088 RepID=UPI001612A112|nr:ATP-binding protein [Mucilaginibacter sp. X5P1]MBB6140738.1 two-component system CheB/CheR fusion protein [Mucilaginibacter sp. X5P1]
MIADPKILILEDNQSDADLLRRELKKSGLNFTSEVVQTRVGFEYALQNFKPDIILSDYSLPSFDAVTAFQIKQINYPQIPFIIVSGIIGEENAVDLIKDGVTDYASKGKLFSLSNKINRALNDTEVRKEKTLTDEKLKVQTAELILANQELTFQNEEKENRAQDLIILSANLHSQKEELHRANGLLLIEEEKVKTINGELLQLNQELEDRVSRRTIALTESEHRFRNMMETIPQIAWTNTADGEFIFYNQRWYDYTGLGQQQTNAAGLKSVIHPDDLKKSVAHFGMIRQAGDGGEFQLRGKREDGRYRWHLVRLMPIKDEKDQIQLWVGTATDIEELRLLQQQKDDFISIASHELKTPITSLKASLQLLNRMKESPSARMSPLIVQANKSLDKVNVLIEDLLNASKANDGQLHMNPKNFILSKVIIECCQYIHTEGVYTIKIEGDMTVEVYADTSRIDQIVINFITNAIKYAPDSKEIIVYIERINGMAKVSVSDQGPGIPPEKLRFLFDRYYRVDNSGSQYTGMGLGLYICAEIIKMHNGQIGVESEIGKGTTFWFTLPVAFS